MKIAFGRAESSLQLRRKHPACKDRYCVADVSQLQVGDDDLRCIVYGCDCAEPARSRGCGPFEILLPPAQPRCDAAARTDEVGDVRLWSKVRLGFRRSATSFVFVFGMLRSFLPSVPPESPALAPSCCYLCCP